MTYILRQSTAVSFMMGPFLDLTAGTTEEGLTIAYTEVRLSKNGADYVAKSETTAMVHKESGMYLCVLDTDDTGTVGTLNVLVDDTANAAIPVSGEYQVVETAVYDALYVNAATAFNSTGQVSLKTATQTSIDAIEADTSELQADWANGGRLDLLIDSIIAEVVTAQTLPAQGVPSATPPVADAIMHMYKAWRNKSTQSATEYKLYNDAGDTVDHKSTLSDSGATFTSGEIGAGP